MFGIVIDTQGYKVEFVILDEDKTPQYYSLKDGESIIEQDWQIANSMNKPQWSGAEWIDTEPLPPEEIEPLPPTKEELLEERVINLEEELVSSNQYITDLELKLLEIDMKLSQ